MSYLEIKKLSVYAKYMRNQKGNVAIILGLIIVLTLGTVLYFNYSQPASYQPISNYSTPATSSPSGQLKTYQSKALRLIVQVPSNYVLNDNTSTISLKSNNGEVDIIREGTNFSSLNDYLKNFDSRRKLETSQIVNSNLTGFTATSRVQYFPEEKIRQKVYYIYVDNWVYVLSTSSESLYPDLDQIAKSFKYTP